MKKLELNQMENLEGGFSFWDGACSGIGITAFAFLAGSITLGAGAAFVLGGASAACGIYATR
jgi:hypothetical protein